MFKYESKKGKKKKKTPLNVVKIIPCYEMQEKNKSNTFFCLTMNKLSILFCSPLGFK